MPGHQVNPLTARWRDFTQFLECGSPKACRIDLLLWDIIECGLLPLMIHLVAMNAIAEVEEFC